MDVQLNPPSKRGHDSESDFPYSGHCANCNCSRYPKEPGLCRQRHNHASSFLVGSHHPLPTPCKDSARLRYVSSSNNLRESSNLRTESHSNTYANRSVDLTGHTLDLPAAWLSQTANDNPNLDLCDAEVTHERVGPGSPWMLQSLWESGGPMGAISPPMEKWNQDHLVQDIRASNLNEPPEFLQFLPRFPLLPEPWPGEDLNLLDEFRPSVDQFGAFISELDNSRVPELAATNTSMTSGPPINPFTPSFGTLSQQTVSPDPSQEVSRTPNENLSFTDPHIRCNPVQFPTNVKLDQRFPSWDITLSPSANSSQAKAKTQHPRKTGKRQGPLKPENAKRAAQIRRQRACWLCWLSKVPCSPEITCHRCSTFHSSPFVGRICNRTPLSDYTNLFFPERLVAHLQVSAVQKVVDDNVVEFSKNCVEIKVASGQGYPTMTLNVRVFRAQEQEFLAVHRLDAGALTNSLPSDATVECHALPLGLPNKDVILLKRKCSEHLKSMVSEESDWSLGNVGIEGGNGLPWRVFNSVERYRRRSTHTNEVDYMLRRATMLYAMHDFMGRVITIADCTGYRGFEHPDTAKELTYDFEVTSKILNRQLKHAMHLVLQDTTRDVLDRLERELKTRTKESWAPCFCTILILCICIEELQIAVDGFAVHKATRRSKTNGFSRASGFETSRRLDDLLYNNCKTLFHAIHNSHKSRAGRRNEKGGFNPIRDTYDVNEKDGITQAMHVLVGEIHEILGDSGNDSVDRAMVPSVDTEDESLAAHMAFREKNSGRLVSDFLRSFLYCTP